MFAEYQLRVMEFISPSNVIYKNIKKSIENLPSGTDEEDWGQIKWMFTRDSQLYFSLWKTVFDCWCEG